MLEDFSGADSTRRRLDTQITATETELQRVEELEMRVRNLKGSASSRRGGVNVTVNSSGGLNGLRLIDTTTVMMALDLAGLTLEIFHEVRRKVTESHVDIVNDEFDKDSSTTGAVADEAQGHVAIDVTDEGDNKKTASNLWRRR